MMHFVARALHVRKAAGPITAHVSGLCTGHCKAAVLDYVASGCNGPKFVVHDALSKLTRMPSALTHVTARFLLILAVQNQQLLMLLQDSVTCRKDSQVQKQRDSGTKLLPCGSTPDVDAPNIATQDCRGGCCFSEPVVPLCDSAGGQLAHVQAQTHATENSILASKSACKSYSAPSRCDIL